LRLSACVPAFFTYNVQLHFAAPGV
ncbi:MAG: hypothetical protein JWO56_2054, partial [Acidobacteria bacterium]|nr:hypothetical protein [Acidobacteriota bacterium]